MQESTIKRIPEIGEYVRGIGTLIRKDNVEPKPTPPPEHEWVFEEVTAEVELLVCDVKVTSYCVFCDGGELNSSIDTAKHEAKKVAVNLKVKADGETEIRVVRIVEHCRKQPSDLMPNYYQKDVLNFDPLKWGCKRDMPDPVRTVVWSTRGGAT